MPASAAAERTVLARMVGVLRRCLSSGDVKRVRGSGDVLGMCWGCARKVLGMCAGCVLGKASSNACKGQLGDGG